MKDKRGVFGCGEPALSIIYFYWKKGGRKEEEEEVPTHMQIALPNLHRKEGKRVGGRELGDDVKSIQCRL